MSETIPTTLKLQPDDRRELELLTINLSAQMQKRLTMSEAVGIAVRTMSASVASGARVAISTPVQGK
jgi:hypothetical protein